MFKAVSRGGGALALLKEFEFILSKLRFRDRSAIFVRKPKGTTFRRKIPGYTPAYVPAGISERLLAKFISSAGEEGK